MSRLCKGNRLTNMQQQIYPSLLLFHYRLTIMTNTVSPFGHCLIHDHLKLLDEHSMLLLRTFSPIGCTAGDLLLERCFQSNKYKVQSICRLEHLPKADKTTKHGVKIVVFTLHHLVKSQLGFQMTFCRVCIKTCLNVTTILLSNPVTQSQP